MSVKTRVGARNMKEVSPSLKRQLNLGLIDSRNLVELLVIDQAQLLQNALKPLVSKSELKEINKLYAPHCELGIMDRLRGAAHVLQQVFGPASSKNKIYQNFSQHISDTVRSWACFMHSNQDYSAKTCLTHLEKFANDPHMGVRECAWMTLRPYIISDFKSYKPELVKWTKRAEDGLRRNAIEATRPRGVWCQHFDLLKQNPEIAVDLLENVNSDQSKYVQNAVANWLNDASKSKPEWVISICKNWSKNNDSKSTAYIVKRAQRTINKK